MNLGVELITESTLILISDHQFRLELYSGNVLLPISVGADVYNLTCNILPHKVVAATGRRASYDIGTGLGPLEAKPAKLVPVIAEELPELTLKVLSNKVLDQAEFKQYFALRIVSDNKARDIHLARPDVKVYWTSRGEFIIPLGHLIN
jgi:hypothetical protein